jgi:hypothetical protein
MNQLAPQQQAPTPRRSDPQVRNKVAHEEVQRLAYHIYLSRGGQEGHELEDWLQAERELRSKRPA